MKFPPYLKFPSPYLFSEGPKTVYPMRAIIDGEEVTITSIEEVFEIDPDESARRIMEGID